MASNVDPFQPNAMVVLSTDKGNTSKKFTKKKDGIDSEPGVLPAKWTVGAFNVPAGVEGLLTVLSFLSKKRDCIVIKEACDPSHMGTAVYRRGPDSKGVFVHAKRDWIFADFDSVPIPDVVRDLDYSAKVSWITDQMFDCFRGVSCVAQLTSSEGVKVTDGSTLRIRLWWRLAKPASRGIVKEMMRRSAEKFADGVIDLSVYNTVQPVYICAPSFEGMDDPFKPEDRVFLVHGHKFKIVDNRDWPDEDPAVADDTDDDDRRFAALYAGTIPNEAEIAERIERILKQTTHSSRHNHAWAACLELRALGCARSVCEDVGLTIISRPKGNDPPRDPTRGELAGIIKAVDAKILSGKARIDQPSISSLLAAADAQEAALAAEGAPITTSGEDIVKQGPAVLFAMCDDYTAACHYRSQIHPDGGFVRWRSNDYVYNGKVWEMLEDDDVLKGRIARYTKLPNRKAASVRDSLRSLCMQEKLNPPCLLASGQRSPNLMAFSNGILDIDEWLKAPKQCELKSHTVDFFNFTMIPFDFDPTAKCPMFHQYLDAVFPGVYADQKREIQKAIGYCLLGDNRFQKMFVLTGMTRSGKGTLVDIIKALVGDGNIRTSDLPSLGDDSFALEGLERTRLLLLPESNESNKKIDTRAVNRLKSITGLDALTVNRKNKVRVDVVFHAKVFIQCNRLPKLYDPSGALQNRTVLFDFPVSFLGREDVTLGAKLKTEMPGILNWALAGLRILLTEDGRFMETAAAAKLAKSFRRTTAPVSAFSEECLARGKELTVTHAETYDTYRAWLVAEGYEYHMSRPDFIQEMERIHGGHIVECRPRDYEKGARPLAWSGIGLTSRGRFLQGADPTVLGMLE